MQNANVIPFNSPAVDTSGHDNKGFAIVNRAINDVPFKRKPTYFALWVHLIVIANHKAKRCDTQKDGVIVIGQGQLLRSWDSLERETGIESRQCRTIASYFKRHDMVSIKTLKSGVLITLKNYTKWQQNEPKNSHPTRTQLAPQESVMMRHSDECSHPTRTQLAPNNNIYTNNTKVLLESDSDESDKNSSTEKTVRKKSPNTPYQKILDLYLDILVHDDDLSLVSVQSLTAKRKRRMKTFWTSMKRDMSRVEKYFRYVFDNRACHSWMFGDNDRGWTADIEYLCREDTVTGFREDTKNNFGSQS